MLRRWIALGVLAAAAVLILLRWDRPGAETTKLETGELRMAPVGGTEDPLASPEDASTPPTMGSDKEARREVELFPTAGHATQLATLEGRFLLPGQSPAAGVRLEVHGWARSDEEARRHVEPLSWKDLAATTRDDGSFSISFDPPGAFQFILDAWLPGHSAVSWRWSEIVPGEVKDLGTIVLQVAGIVAVRIVDSSGNPLTEGWSVAADGDLDAASPGRVATRVIAYEARADGTFVLENLPPGRVRLDAYSRMANKIDGAEVVVESGSTVETELRYAGPNNTRRITIGTSTDPFYLVRPESTAFRLSAPGIDPRTATEVQGSYSFDDLDPGTYRVELEDPRFLPWSEDGVHPGTALDVRLKGSCTLVLEVVDGGHGERVADYRPLLRFRNVRFWPREFALLEDDESPPNDGAFDGIVPGDFTLVVSSPGRPTTEVPVDRLAPGERRALRIELGASASVRGRLQRAEGAAVPHVEVKLRPQAEPGAWTRTDMDPFELHQELEGRARLATTDRAGRFAFEDLPPGTYDLASGCPPLQASTIVEVRSGDALEVELVFPPACSLDGRVLAPGGASFAGLRVSLEMADIDFSDPVAFLARFQAFSPAETSADLAMDGGFRLGPVAPGSYDVTLRLPDVVTKTMRGPGEQRTLARLALVPGDLAGVVLDARESFPGRLEIRATLGGSPLADREIFAITRTGDQTVRLSDEAGNVSLLLFPASYRLSMTDPGGAWIAASRNPIEVSPGSETSFDFRIELHLGTLRILDAATGIPLTDRPIRLGPNYPWMHELSLKTDPNGDLSVALPPGEYRLADGTSAGRVGPVERAIVDWDASGPAMSEIRIVTVTEDE